MSPAKSLFSKKNNLKVSQEYNLPPSCSVSNLSEFLADGNASFLRAARSGNSDKVIEFLKGNIDINTSNANGLNALHLAAKEGHVNVVTELIKRGANVNAATKKGNTALHIASLAGQEEVVKVLIQLGANVNVQSQNGFTPLYMAAQENHDTVVSFLLASGANQSLATEDGFTPLAVALQQGHDKVVAVLLENDTKGKVRLPALHIAAKKDDCKAATLLLQSDHNPDVTSKSGFTPLHIAAHYGNENIAKILLSKGADVNYAAKHQITPLHVASKWGKTNMVVLLLEKGANIESATRDGLTPLHCAARSGHDQVVDLLLEKEAPFLAKTKNGLAPLHMASQGDHVDSARILLYHKAPVDDVTVDYLTALHVAAHCGHVKVAKLLLDRKADPNARALNGFTPLHIACKKNRIKVVELLLKHGASIEATTESGLTPLHVASFMGCMNIVIYLIQNGANPDVPTVRGETPLHLAARANQTDIIRILLRNGASVDARAREEQTPLHIAARLGNVDIVSLLLQHGAAVDAVTKDMYTALHITAKEDQEEVAAALLDHGASLTATTKKGFTPLHLAAKYGNIKVARLLLQKDAPVDAQGKNGVTPLHVAAHYNHVNVALLLLDKEASPHAMAKNGYTPLHIVAKKNQMDIASTLLEYGANTNAESKAGFTPLHLASQEGHSDMSSLLIDHKANVNHKANNGLTSLHLCAQEDRVNVAQVLVKNGAEVCPQTKAGYTPLHVAAHFGQINMVRFLLQNDANVHTVTTHGYTPLHQAAQQGHTLVVNLLLENQASPNVTTMQGQTPLSIAQRLGYISVVETLKVVTETTVTTTTTTVTEEKYKVVAPETMQETFMTDSEDEGGADFDEAAIFGKPIHATHVYLPYVEGQNYYMSEEAMLGDQSYKYLTADEMKSLGDDSLPIDVTKDEKQQDALQAVKPFGAPMVEEDNLSPQHVTPVESGFSEKFSPDNVDLAKAPIHAGRFSVDDAFYYFPPKGMLRSRFLVSFMVDARGGAMRGCRHSGVRVIIPPRKASMPMRITCRYLRKEKLIHPPPLMEGEACASRILEMGPVGARFLGPVIIEVPHFASTRGKEREITILRSDTGENWREHTLEASEEAVQEVLNESFEGEELSALEDLNTNRITRILTTDFPQYFAIVSRIRQEVHGVGPEGGMVSSTVVPQVQAIFPERALTKKIRVGLQAQPIAPELVAKLLGNRVAVSPIVTVEPRRRKFHKPITLTIPVPQAATKGMINQYSGDAPTLRLLCSITGSTKSGGSSKAQWEDVTGSTPLTFVNDCVSFTTTVSARFWLMDCRQVNEVTRFATELYQEAVYVPFMSKFVIFAKRHDPFEAQLRVFCMTDDKEDKTLESQEHFTEVAKSRDVEVLEGKLQYLEFAGNLVPVTKSGEQLKLDFQAFHENRLPFTIRVKDPHAESMGRIAFMKEPKAGRGEPPQTPICNLNVALPEITLAEGTSDVLELVTLEKSYEFIQEAGLSKPELIHRADLRLSDIARELDKDWVLLAQQLDIPEQDSEQIKAQTMCDSSEQARMMLRLWLQKSGPKATGNELEKGLRKINREDIIKNCMFNVELVTDDVEKAVAKVHLDQSGFDVFKEELGSSREASMRRGTSLDVSYDEQDIMKEAESAAETSSETGSIFERDQLSHAISEDKDECATLSVHETMLSVTDSSFNKPISSICSFNEPHRHLFEAKEYNFNEETESKNIKSEACAEEHTPLLITYTGKKLHDFWPSNEIIQQPATVSSSQESSNISIVTACGKFPEEIFDEFEKETIKNKCDENLLNEKNENINQYEESNEIILSNVVLQKECNKVIKSEDPYEKNDLFCESSVSSNISFENSEFPLHTSLNKDIKINNPILQCITEYDAILEPDTKLFSMPLSNTSIFNKNGEINKNSTQTVEIEDITSDRNEESDKKLKIETLNLKTDEQPTSNNYISVSQNIKSSNELISEPLDTCSFEKNMHDSIKLDSNSDILESYQSVRTESGTDASDLGYFSLDKDLANISGVSDKHFSENDKNNISEILSDILPEAEEKIKDILMSDDSEIKNNVLNKMVCHSMKEDNNLYIEKDIYTSTINETENISGLKFVSKRNNEKISGDAKLRRASKTPPPSPIDETINKGGSNIEKLNESAFAAAFLPVTKDIDLKKTIETEIKSTEATVGDSIIPSTVQEIPAKLTESETWPSGDLDTSQVSVSSLPDDEKSETTVATVPNIGAITVDITKKTVPDTELDEDLDEETLSPTKFKEDLCLKKVSPTKSIFETKIFLSPKIPVQLTPDKILCLQELALSPVKEVSEIETKETCTSPCSDKLETVKPNQLISTRKGFRTRKRLSPIHDGMKIEHKLPSRVDRGLSPIAVLTAGPSGVENEGTEYFVQTYDAPAMQEPVPTSDMFCSKGTEMSPKSVCDMKSVSAVSVMKSIQTINENSINQVVKFDDKLYLQDKPIASSGNELTQIETVLEHGINICVKVEKSTSPLSDVMLDTGIGTDSPITADTASSPFLPDSLSPSSISVHSSAQMLKENSSTQTIHVEMLSAHTSPIDGPFSLQESNISCCGTDCSLKSDSLDDISRTMGTPSSDNVEIDVDLNYPLSQNQFKDLPISTVREFLEEHTISDNISDVIETEDLSTPSSHEVSSKGDLPGYIEDSEAVNKILVIESFRNVFATEPPFSVMTAQQRSSPKKNIEYKKKKSLILSETSSSEDKIFSLHDQLLSEESALESSTDSGVDLKESSQGNVAYASVVQTSLHKDKKKISDATIKYIYKTDKEQESICIESPSFQNTAIRPNAEILVHKKNIIKEDIPEYIKKTEEQVLSASTSHTSVSSIKTTNILHTQHIVKPSSCEDNSIIANISVDKIDSNFIEQKTIVPEKVDLPLDSKIFQEDNRSSTNKYVQKQALDYLQEVESEICTMYDAHSPSKEIDVLYMQEIFEPNLNQDEIISVSPKPSVEYKYIKSVEEEPVVPIKASLSFDKEASQTDRITHLNETHCKSIDYLPQDNDALYMQDVFEPEINTTEITSVTKIFSDQYKSKNALEDEPLKDSLSFETDDNLNFNTHDKTHDQLKKVESEIYTTSAISKVMSPTKEIDVLYMQEIFKPKANKEVTSISPKLYDEYENKIPVEEKLIQPVKASLSFENDVSQTLSVSSVQLKTSLSEEDVKSKCTPVYVEKVEDTMLNAYVEYPYPSAISEVDRVFAQDRLKQFLPADTSSSAEFEYTDSKCTDKELISVKSGDTGDIDSLNTTCLSLSEADSLPLMESVLENNSAKFMSDKETFSNAVDRIFSNVDIDSNVSKLRTGSDSNVFVAEATVIKDKRHSMCFSGPQILSPKLEQNTNTDTIIQEITEVDKSGATTHIIQKTTHMTLSTHIKSEDDSLEGDLQGAIPVDSQVEDGSSTYSPELSFAEKRDFFQKLSLSSSSPSATPTHTSKTNIETEIELLPVVSDNIISSEASPEEQLSFVERVRFFENSSDVQVQIVQSAMPEIKEIKKEVWTVSENELSEPKSAVYSDDILEKEREIEIIEVTEETSLIVSSTEEVSSPLYSGKEVLETPFDTNKDAKVEVMVKKLSPGSEMIEICSVENIDKTETDVKSEIITTKYETDVEQNEGKSTVLFETCKVQDKQKDHEIHSPDLTVSVLPEIDIKTDEEFISQTFRNITENSQISPEVSKSTMDAFKKGVNDKIESKWQRESPDNISIVKETMEPTLGKSEIFICTEETLDNVKKILSMADAESNIVVPEGESPVFEASTDEKDKSDEKDKFICSEETAQVQKILSIADAECSEILHIKEKDEGKVDGTDAVTIQSNDIDSDTKDHKILRKNDEHVPSFSEVVTSKIGSSPESPMSEHISLKLELTSVHSTDENICKEKIDTGIMDESSKKQDAEDHDILSHTGSLGDRSESSLSSVKDRSIEIEFVPVLEVSDDVKITADKTGHEALGTPCSFHKEMSIESQHSELEQSFENRHSDSSNGKKIPLTTFAAVEKAEYEEVEKPQKEHFENVFKESIGYEKSQKETVQCVKVTQFTKHTTEVYNVPSEKLREKFSSKKIHIDSSIQEKDSKTFIPQKLNQFLDSVTQLDDLALPSDVAPVHKRTEEWLDQSGDLFKEAGMVEGVDNGLFEDRPPTDDEPHRRSSPTAESFDDKARVEQCDTDVMMQLLDFVSRNDIELAEVRTEDEAPDIEEDVSPSGEEEICTRLPFEESKIEDRNIIHETIEEKAEEYLRVTDGDNIIHSPLKSSFDSVTSPSKRDASLDNIETVVDSKQIVENKFKCEQISQQIHPQSSLEVEVGSHDSDELGYNIEVEREIVPLSFVEEEKSVRHELKQLNEDDIFKIEDTEQCKEALESSIGIDSEKKLNTSGEEISKRNLTQKEIADSAFAQNKIMKPLDSIEHDASRDKTSIEHVQQMSSETLIKETAVTNIEDSFKISKDESDDREPDSVIEAQDVHKPDPGFVPCAFVNTAFAGAEVIDEVEQAAPIRARSPYEVIRSQIDQILDVSPEEIKDSYNTAEKISSISRNFEIKCRPILQHIPSEISEEDLVEREIVSPVLKETNFSVPVEFEKKVTSNQVITETIIDTTDTESSKFESHDVKCGKSITTTKIITTIHTFSSDADQEEIIDNIPICDIKIKDDSSEYMGKTDDVTTPDTDTGIPTSPFEFISDSELSDGEHKSYPLSHSLPKSDKNEKFHDSLIMTTHSQSLTEKTISVSMASSSKDGSDSCTLNDQEEPEKQNIVSPIIVHSKVTNTTTIKPLENGPGEVEYDAEYDYDEESNIEKVEKNIVFEEIDYPERPFSETQVIESKKCHYGSVSDEVIDLEIKGILDSDQQAEDIFERPVTPEPPKDDLSVVDMVSKNLNRLSSGAIEDLTRVEDFAYPSDDGISPASPDSKSGFAYGMQFEKYVLDQAEEAMDVDSDQYSEEKEPPYNCGMRFEHDPDLEDEDMPCYGDLYTHEEEDEDVLENGEKSKIIQKPCKDSEFDILAGRKYFTKNVEVDEMSMSSLQEFEHLEAEIVSGRKSSIGSIDSLNGKQSISKSGEHDDVSMSSLTEFERLEKECIEGEKIDPSMQESITQLSEIEEGHESQASEASQENKSDAGKEEDISIIEEYNDQLDNIEEIILTTDAKKQEALPFQLMMKQSQKVEQSEDGSNIPSKEEKFTDSRLLESTKLKTLTTDIATETHKISGWTTTKSFEISETKEDLDQDSLHDELSLKPDSLIDDGKQEFQDSLHERFDETDSLQEENMDEMRDSLFEERHIEDDSLHDMDILPDESSLSLEGSIAAVASLDSSKADEPFQVKIIGHRDCKDNQQDSSSITTIHSNRKTQINISDFPKNIDTMQSSTDSLEQSSSAALAAFHIESESIMSSSLNSAITSEDYTMISSTDTLEQEGKITYRYEDIPVDDIEMLIRSGHRVIVDSEGNIQTHYDAKQYIETDDITNAALNLSSKDKTEVQLPPTSAIQVHSALTTHKYINGNQKQHAFHSSSDANDSKYESSHFDPDVEVEEIETTDEFGNKKIIRKIKKITHTKTQFSSSSSSKDMEEKLKEFLRDHTVGDNAGTAEEEIEEEKTTDEKGNIVVVRTVKQQIVTEPEVHSRTFTGPNADELSKDFVETFKTLDPTDDIQEYEKVDEQGNVVHVTQQFVVTPQMHTVSFSGPDAHQQMEEYMKQWNLETQNIGEFEGDQQRSMLPALHISRSSEQHSQDSVPSDPSENLVHKIIGETVVTKIVTSSFPSESEKMLPESSTTTSISLETDTDKPRDSTDEIKSMPK